MIKTISLFYNKYKVALYLLDVILVLVLVYKNYKLKSMERKYYMLEEASKSKDEYIKFLKFDRQNQIYNIENLLRKINDENISYDQKRLKISESEGKLVNVSRNKPKVTELIINKSFNKLMLDFESATAKDKGK